MLSISLVRTGARAVRLFAVLALSALTGCGGGGNGDAASPPPPPVIQASVISFPENGVPPGFTSAGFNTAVSVAVLNATSGASISTAAVSINGKAAAYVPTFEDYETELKIAPGDRVTVTVNVGGVTYSVAGRQFIAYPSIDDPAPHTTWLKQDPHNVSWSAAPATGSAFYALGVTDTNGQSVWPANAIQMVAPNITSFTIPASSLTTGSRYLIVGIADQIAVPQAASNSGLVIGGFNQVPVTVSDTLPPTLLSLTITPRTSALGKGATRQLTATGLFSTSATVDITSQVAWTSTDPARVSVSASGLVTGVDFGPATITATMSGVSDRVSMTVFQPNPSPSPPLTQAVTYQIDYAHSGRAVFATPPTFPPLGNWTRTLSAATSYPLVAGGKVFVIASAANANDPSAKDLYALDLATGNTVWGPTRLVGNFPWAAHAYDHGRIFVVNVDGLLTVFDAATGAQGWSVQLPGQYLTTAPPTAVNGIVYVSASGSGGNVYAIDESNGNVLWVSGVSGGDNSSPAVSPDGVFVAYPCQAYKFDPLTGETLWHYMGGCSGGGGRTTAYANGRLYARDWASPTANIFDSASGAIVGTFHSYSNSAIPALSTQTGYFLDEATLRGVDLASLAVQWSFAGDGQLVSAPIVINNVVIIASSTGTVYALDAATGMQMWSGSAGGTIYASDNMYVGMPPTGLGAGEGWLVVPTANGVTAWKVSGP